MSEGVANTWNVLLLGDGNFSFSLSLMSRFHQLSLARCVKVFCTSFDSYDEVIDKYPESKTVLKKLAKDDRCLVAHSVNATTISRHFPEQRFSEIVFNFPHLGFEDLHSHRALVAHYFHSSLECLAPGGVVTVALSSDQSDKWEIRQTGLRLGLGCISTVPMLPFQWPGYMLKRHHTGKSFANRVNDLYHFIFKRTNERTPESSTSVLQELHTVATTMPDTVQTSLPPMTKEDKKKGKKRVHLLVEGRYVESGSEFLCQECSRTFPTEQGVRTHVYNVHILSPGKKLSLVEITNQEYPAIRAAGALVTCPDCGKECSDEGALQQHKVAKHIGENLCILPYWKTSSHEPTVGPGASSEGEDFCGDKAQCPVCLLHFDSEDAIQLHMSEGLMPVSSGNAASVPLACELCNKQFCQERALLQHKNFCVQRGLRYFKQHSEDEAMNS